MTQHKKTARFQLVMRATRHSCGSVLQRGTKIGTLVLDGAATPQQVERLLSATLHDPGRPVPLRAIEVGVGFATLEEAIGFCEKIAGRTIRDAKLSGPGQVQTLIEDATRATRASGGDAVIERRLEAARRLVAEDFRTLLADSTAETEEDRAAYKRAEARGQVGPGLMPAGA